MSIPTSLIIVVLVAAWLAVLVPMVARRREAVPETDVDGGTFRVLRRASATIRRRPKFTRRDVVDDEEYLDTLEGADVLESHQRPGDEISTEELDEELLDGEADELDDEEFEDQRFEEVRFEEEVRYEEVRYEEVQYEERQYAEVGAIHRPAGRSDAAADDYDESDPDDYSSSSEPSEPSGRSQDQTRRRRRDPLEGVDEAQLRPVPRRHGRGGFDPDAAELARAYRYSRRRRVTVVLLLATIAFSAAAYLFKPVLWTGTAVFGLLLVAYLGYLRRQVRIETDIRQRRLERLRRARQIRPEYHLDRIEEPITGHAFGRRDVVASQVPPSGYRRGREIVDLEDDDPSFDDLDYYQPIQYRRASGQ